MTDAAGGIILYSELTMSPGPIRIMARRLLITIHVDMAHEAILSGMVCVITDLYDILALQPGHGIHIFGHDYPVAFLTFSRHGFCVHKQCPARCFRFRFPLFKRGQQLFLMAVATGVLVYLLCLRLIVAISTGFMTEGIEGWPAKIAMALIAIHVVICDMDIVAEFQLIFIFVAPDQKQQCCTGKQKYDFAARFHNRTWSEVRIL